MIILCCKPNSTRTFRVEIDCAESLDHAFAICRERGYIPIRQAVMPTDFPL